MQSFRSIKASDIVVENVVALKQGRGLLIKLSQSNGKKITFQTPIMPLAWDAQVRVQDSGATTCALPLSFASVNNSITDFHTWLYEVRTRVRTLIQENALEWYGKALTEDQVDEYLGPLVKEPPADSSYSATFLPKLSHVNNNDGTHHIDVKVFGTKKEVYDADVVLKKGARAAAIIQIPYVHISKSIKNFSIRSDATQVLAIPAPDEAEFAFDMDADQDFKAAAQENNPAKANEAEEPAAKRAAFDMHEYAEEDDV